MTIDEMLGSRLLVVSNLKAKNLVRFKSHGMVLCAKETLEDGSKSVVVATIVDSFSRSML